MMKTTVIMSVLLFNGFVAGLNLRMSDAHVQKVMDKKIHEGVQNALQDVQHALHANDVQKALQASLDQAGVELENQKTLNESLKAKLLTSQQQEEQSNKVNAELKAKLLTHEEALEDERKKVKNLQVEFEDQRRYFVATSDELALARHQLKERPEVKKMQEKLDEMKNKLDRKEKELDRKENELRHEQLKKIVPEIPSHNPRKSEQKNRLQELQNENKELKAQQQKWKRWALIAIGMTLFLIIIFLSYMFC